MPERPLHARRRHTRQAIVSACVLLSGLAGLSGREALAAPPTLPPLLQPSTTERHPGKVILDQLVTPDLATAERFYGGLFGWTFRALPDAKVPYATAWLRDRAVAGLYQRSVQSGEHGQSAWLTFFSATDVDAVKALAIQHGAHVLFGPRTIPDRGREAVLQDPQGAVFAVLASASGDPPDQAAGVGDWIWRSLITPDPDNDAAFYQTLLGDDVYDVTAAAADPRHLILAAGGYARASVNALPSSRPGAHPRWLNYIRVDDVAATSAKAASLGGRILVQPRLDHSGTRIAVIADPLGAPLGLMEWSDTGSQADAK
ncbi:VOC family protein [Lichenicoccus sp.]|uniref:VOC family protein n=1 Tax=Lichenicoccus sp. TaxID=2781899 RepID=UPI003D147F33